MEIITASIVSGIIYDIFKTTGKLLLGSLRTKLQEFIIDDTIVEKLAKEISQMELNDEMSEKAITSKLEASTEILELLKQASSKTSKKVEITQINTNGDNVIKKIKL